MLNNGNKNSQEFLNNSLKFKLIQNINRLRFNLLV